jgi:hypothetical protein
VGPSYTSFAAHLVTKNDKMVAIYEASSLFGAGNAHLPDNFFLACDYNLCHPKSPSDKGRFLLVS